MSMIMDFIVHSEPYFKCLSTSDCWQDVQGHFELFKPDVYVCFVDSIYSKILTQTNTLKGNDLYNDAPIFVIADQETCDELDENPRRSIDVVIRRPISTDNLILRLTMHLEERERAQREAEEEAAAKEAARQAALAERAAQNKNGKSGSLPDNRPVAWIPLKEDPNKKETMSAADKYLKTWNPPPKTEEKISPSDKYLKTWNVEPKKEETQQAAVPKTKERKHILIVDDDRTVLKMLKTALEDNYDVTTMVNGIMVEKFLMSKEVDMIILDYEMPGETGADIFRKLKANDKAKRVPVCFLTGITDREKIMEVMSLKPHSYLLKPIDMDMLKAAISNLTK